MSTTRLPHLALLASTLFGAVACAREPISAPPPTGSVTASELAYRDRVRRAIENAADGLLYMSESDHPFEYYFRAARVEGTLDEATFRALAGIASTDPVEQITLDAFFARHVENVDPSDSVAVALAPEYEKLKRTLERELEQPRVFRVGTVVVGCFVVGTDRDGNVVGVTTTAIET